MPPPIDETRHPLRSSNDTGQRVLDSVSISSTEKIVHILREHIFREYENDGNIHDLWRTLPEIPTAAEIMPIKTDATASSRNNMFKDENKNESALPVNLINGPWQSKNDYVSAHYRLLREDGIAPLRSAVEDFKAQPGMMDDGDTCIYTQVFIVGYTMSTQGAAPRIEFSYERAGKRIRWKQSKRLQQGTLVALSPRRDMFNSICKVAVVAARPLHGLEQNPPQIDLFWGDTNVADFDPIEEYVMVESRSGYFEAYRHVLVAMQKLMVERFPLAEHLAYLNQTIRPPMSLERQPLRNLNSLVHDPTPFNMYRDGTSMVDKHLNGSLSNVDILKDWPKIPGTQLDGSQMKALKRILTKKLAIVQGPPGTGKTFVSISALRVMLDNWSHGDPPIIVSSQTNHGLDQLLTMLAKTDPDLQTAFIRLGGRTSEDNKPILERTLYEVRQNDSQRRGQSGGIGFANYRNCKNALASSAEKILSIIQKGLDQSIDEAQKLLEAGVINRAQFESLQDDEWIYAHDPDIPPGAMAVWLGREQIVDVPRCVAVNLGFKKEEIDSEFEELEELEAETRKRDDDDIDALRGDYHSFREKFTGRRTPGWSDMRLRKLLRNTDNLWDIPETIRGEVYSFLRRKLKTRIVEGFRTHIKDYAHRARILKLARWQSDMTLLGRVGIKLIGCTTTGLSKYRGLLASLQPRTLFIEEAAETLEATILAAQLESLEQLILVGDHEQLQSSCNVTALSLPPYNLAISMFERLVNNGTEYTMLEKQRRMISEIRELLNSIYPNLKDHHSVLDRELNRKPVPGMGGRDSYWFHHKWPERRDETASRYNIDEAEMIANFFAYLVMNGVNPSHITVLTFYNGQRKVLLKELKNNPHLSAYVGTFNVYTVDSYQGEENDIILLSLVRSNDYGDIGFLENKNRAVVALSRARRGMYIFGNVMNLLLQRPKSYDIWYTVTGKLVASNPKRLDIDRGFPIVCSRHANETIVNEPFDWKRLAGGCTIKCDGELPCGHSCPHLCHPFSHEAILCKKPCMKTMPGCGHSCSERCGDHCQCPCDIPFEASLAGGGESEFWPPSLDELLGDSPQRSSINKSPSKYSHRHTISQISTADSFTHSLSSEDSNRNAWGNWDAAKADRDIERAHASSRSAPTLYEMSIGPTLKDTHRPVSVQNGARIKKTTPSTVRLLPIDGDSDNRVEHAHNILAIRSSSTSSFIQASPSAKGARGTTAKAILQPAELTPLIGRRFVAPQSHKDNFKDDELIAFD